MQGHNPFAPPTADLEPERAELSHAEQVRKAHIGHELNLKTVAGLYLLGAFVSLVMLASVWVNFKRDQDASILGVGAGILVAFVAQSYAGIELRRLRRGGRVPGVLLAVVLLLAIPVGTVIGIAALYLLLSPKAGVILSEEYVRIVEDTPHIRYKTPRLVWVALAILVLGLLGLGFFMG